LPKDTRTHAGNGNNHSEREAEPRVSVETESGTGGNRKSCHIFYVSDGTAITAETVGHSLITQFNDVKLLTKMEDYLGVKRKAVVGQAHGMSDYQSYEARINATNYALACTWPCNTVSRPPTTP